MSPTPRGRNKKSPRKEPRQRSAEDRILRKVRALCDNDGHEISVLFVARAYPFGSRSGVSVALRLPSGLTPDSLEVRSIIEQIRTLPGLDTVAIETAYRDAAGDVVLAPWLRKPAKA